MGATTSLFHLDLQNVFSGARQSRGRSGAKAPDRQKIYLAPGDQYRVDDVNDAIGGFHVIDNHIGVVDG